MAAGRDRGRACSIRCASLSVSQPCVGSDRRRSPRSPPTIPGPVSRTSSAAALTSKAAVAVDTDVTFTYNPADVTAANAANVVVSLRKAGTNEYRLTLPSNGGNAVVAKKGSLAYDTSKAAANHLVRELAIELAPLVRVNAVAPATVVKGSTMFPRDRVIASLAKYAIEFSEDEDTETLRGKLANFYAKRTLTQTAIEPEDQAEAIFLLVSQRLAKTTGHVIPVDGGLQDGFLR